MQKSARSNGWLKWLLLLNLIGLILLGGRYWYQAQQNRRVERKQTEASADVEVMVTGAPRDDVTRILELSHQFERKQGISDADLDWLLGQLKSRRQLLRGGAAYRMIICQTLAMGASQMQPEQKERAFQAASEVLAHADRSEEIGMDVVGSAAMMGFLGDKRAIPLLRPLREDKRFGVHRMVGEALAKLEAKTAQ